MFDILHYKHDLNKPISRDCIGCNDNNTSINYLLNIFFIVINYQGDTSRANYIIFINQSSHITHIAKDGIE